MSNDKMKIPSKIKVGYNNRKDTYTGKLAYVIYYDEKGKLRKETSWKSWCDNKLGSDEYPNDPTSGFVLNKKVGDYKSDWNHRMAHIRVYDPRGFEFEISVENLLYILQECTSTKGKGLEGDFVYAWDDKNLVLLPVSSQEYISSKVFTDGLNKKVGKADMKEGCIYITKNQEEVMYLGKQDWYEPNNGNYLNDRLYQWEYKGKKHIFAFMKSPENKYNIPYFADGGFTKLSSKVSDVISTDYADRFDSFKKGLYGGGIVEIILTPISNTNPDQYWNHRLIKIDGNLYYCWFQGNSYFDKVSDESILNMYIRNKIIIDGNKITTEYINNSYYKQMTFKESKELEYYKIYGKMLNGNQIEITP